MEGRAGEVAIRLIKFKSGNSAPIECVTNLAGCCCYVERPILRLETSIVLSQILLESAVVGRLQFKHFGITSTTPEKLIVRTLLGNRPVFKDEYAVRHPNR